MDAQTVATTVSWASYIPVLLPYSLLMFLFGYTWRRLGKLQDTKVEKETFKVVEVKVNEKLDEVKEQNGRIHTKMDKQEQKITEMSTNIKWIVDSLKRNGGVKNA